MQPILGPEGIEYLEPKGGFPLTFSSSDRIRWAHLAQVFRRSMSQEKADSQAFLHVYSIKWPSLTYSEGSIMSPSIVAKKPKA
jgi:hypothetical protein